MAAMTTSDEIRKEAIKAKLESELAASAQSPDVKAKFEAVGFDVVANNSSQFPGSRVAPSTRATYGS